MQPCFLFVGEAFEREARFKLAKSLLLDLFRGEEVAEVALLAIGRVVVCLASGSSSLQLRHFAVLLKKSGTKVRLLPFSVPSSNPHFSTRLVVSVQQQRAGRDILSADPENRVRGGGAAA